MLQPRCIYIDPIERRLDRFEGARLIHLMQTRVDWSTLGAAAADLVGFRTEEKLTCFPCMGRCLSRSLSGCSVRMHRVVCEHLHIWGAS
jgi:hypothetical protein